MYLNEGSRDYVRTIPLHIAGRVADAFETRPLKGRLTVSCRRNTKPEVVTPVPWQLGFPTGEPPP